MKTLSYLLFALAFINIASATENPYRSTVLKSIQGTGFNGVVLISKQGRTVLHENIGFADREKTVALDDKHLFSPGSVGKEFTTISIMQLVAQGKLSYQDKVATFIDFLPAGSENMTVEHILTHTSGLPKIKWHKHITTSDAIQQIQQSQLDFVPGEGYLYSNLNVVVRALLVEKISGQPYAAFLQKYIFDRASMSDSYLQLTKDDISPDKVFGDYPTFLTGVTIYVTPLDLLRFEQALWEAKLVPTQQLKQALQGDKLSGKQSRAYFDFGSFVENEQGELIRWEHDGSNPSHHTLKFHDFSNETVIVLMSNDGNKSTLYQLRDDLQQLISKGV